MKPEKASLHTPTGVLHNPKDCLREEAVCGVADCHRSDGGLLFIW